MAMEVKIHKNLESTSWMYTGNPRRKESESSVLPEAERV